MSAPPALCAIFWRSASTRRFEELYEAVKENFGLRRRQISREGGSGQGNLDTDYFRFSIDTRQNPSDPASYVIIRRLVLRGEPG